MKGIILAGGTGSRLYPMTKVVTKQLQNVYDKPMIYYSLSFLMLGGINDILLISTPQDLPQFQNLLGDGSNLGIQIRYMIQEKPTGLPDAFLLGADFIANQDVCLILGDNLFYGDMTFFRDALEKHGKRTGGYRATIFGYSVSDPQNYGVIEFERHSRKIKSIVEKPTHPVSNYAIPGLYLFDGTVSGRAETIKPSPRGETEIVDLILSYHRDQQLGVDIIPRGIAWLDTGTPRTLLDAALYIGALEQRQGLKVACLEEVALRMGFIDLNRFQKCISSLPKSSYRDYLEKIQHEFE